MPWFRRVSLCALLVVTAFAPTQFAASAATAPYCGAALYKSNGTAWQCTFDDEFAGTKLDSTKWTAVTTAQTGLAYANACFVDSTNNIYVSGGALNLTARKEHQAIQCAKPYAPFSTRYTAGEVATTGRFSQTYGLFAVRAKFPAATVAGLQSSLWMWPQNLYSTGLHGEIDIAEEYSAYADRVIPYLHYTYDTATTNTLTNTNVVTRNCMLPTVSSFHDYVAQWDSATITIYIDGKVCMQDNVRASGTSPFDQPFFLALTQALGSGTNAFSPTTTPLPATTVVDWVRAWK